MQMDDGAGLGPLLIHHAMEKALLCRRIAGKELAVGAELREPCGVEPSERDIGRCHQPAIGQLRADIAGAASGESAREDRGAEPANFRAKFRLFAHGSTVKLRKKKSGPPKLPDFKASAS